MIGRVEKDEPMPIVMMRPTSSMMTGGQSLGAVEHRGGLLDKGLDLARSLQDSRVALGGDHDEADEAHHAHAAREDIVRLLPRYDAHGEHEAQAHESAHEERVGLGVHLGQDGLDDEAGDEGDDGRPDLLHVDGLVILGAELGLALLVLARLAVGDEQGDSTAHGHRKRRGSPWRPSG